MRNAMMLALAALTAAAAVPAAAKDDKPFAVNNPDVGVPVFATDITDRSYTTVGTVKASVRKSTIFSSEASQTKVYRELWERARKLGADAVVKATYGNSHVTAMSWGATTAEGVAVKFAEPAAATTDAAAK